MEDERFVFNEPVTQRNSVSLWAHGVDQLVTNPEPRGDGIRFDLAPKLQRIRCTRARIPRCL
jgi:hypothetical protein